MIINPKLIMAGLATFFIIRWLIIPGFKIYKNPSILYKSAMYQQVSSMLNMLKYEYKQWKIRRRNKKYAPKR